MSSEEKIKGLDDKFLECEAIKSKTIAEIQEIYGRFQTMQKSLGSTDQANVEAILSKLKDFLRSASTTIMSIQQNVDQIYTQFSNIHSTLRSMGAQ